MHPTILVKRKAHAINRILAKAEALATQLELDPELVDAMQPKGIKDPQVVETIRLEAVANLLDQLAAKAGVAEAAAVTTETAAGEADLPSTHEALPSSVPGDAELPPAVLEEESAPYSDSKSNTPAEEASSEEVPKMSKKGTHGKRSKK